MLKPLSHQSGVLTAFPQRLKNCRTSRCALCKRQQRCGNAVETLCNRLERHPAAFILSMLKTNAAAWRFHSVLNSTLWGLLERRVHAVKTPCTFCIWSRRLQCILIIKQIIIICIKIYKVFIIINTNGLSFI